MKPETETLIRNVVSLDPEISRENAEKALDIMRGKVCSDCDLVHVLRFNDVCDMLHIHRRTLEYYISRGHFDKVYGRGERAIGVTRDSFLRFTTQRRVVHVQPRKSGGAETTVTHGRGVHEHERRHMNKSTKGKHR